MENTETKLGLTRQKEPTSYAANQTWRGSGQMELSTDYLKKSDPVSYYYNKFRQEENALLNDRMWQEASLKGESDQLIELINLETNKASEPATIANITKAKARDNILYSENSSYDEYMLALQAPYLDDTTKKDRYNDDSTHKFGSYTDREWAYEVLTNIQKQQDAITVEETKKNSSFVARTAAAIGGLGTKLLTGAMRGLNDIWNVIEGLGKFVISGGDKAAFYAAFDDEDYIFSDFVTADKQTDEMLAEYTNLINYTTGEFSSWGKVLVGMADSIGYMVPSMVFAAATGGTSMVGTALAAGGKLAKAASLAVRVTQETLFYTQIFSDNIKENVQLARANGVSYSDMDSGRILGNAALKAGLEYGITKVLGVLLKFTPLQRLLGISKSSFLAKQGSRAAKYATYTGAKARAVVVGRAALDMFKEGLEEVCQDLSNNIVDMAFGGDYAIRGREQLTAQNLGDAFLLGALTSGVITAVSGAAGPKNKMYKLSNGEAVKMSFSQALNYKEAITVMNDWNAVLNNPKASAKAKSDAAFKLTAAVNTIGNVTATMGTERAAIASTMLADMTGAQEAKRVAGITETMTDTQYASKLYENYMKEFTETQTKGELKQLEDSLKKAIKNKKDTLEDADVFKLENIVSVESTSATSNLTPDKLAEIKKSLNTLGADILVGVNGNVVTSSSGVVFADSRLINNNDVRNIIKGVVYDKAKSEVKAKLNKSQEALIVKAYSDITGTISNIDDAIAALLFDKSFYTFTLMRAYESGTKYGEKTIELLSVLDKVIKESISQKVVKGSVVASAYKLLLNKLQETMQTGLITFATRHAKLDLDDVSLDILPANIKQIIRDNRNVIVTEFIDTMVTDQTTHTSERLDRFDKIADSFSTYIPIDTIEFVKKAIRSTNINDRFQARSIIAIASKVVGGTGTKLVYLPTNPDNLWTQEQLNGFKTATGVSLNDFISGNYAESELTQNVYAAVNELGDNMNTPEGRILTARWLLYNTSNHYLTLDDNGVVLEVLSSHEFIKPEYLTKKGQLQLLEDIRSGKVKTIGDICKSDIDSKYIRGLDIVLDTNLNEPGSYLPGDNKIEVKGIKVIETIMHEVTHAAQYETGTGQTEVIAGANSKMFDVLPVAVKKSLSNYLEENFPELNNYLLLLKQDLPARLYFMVAGELQANATLASPMFETGFRFTNDKQTLISPDGKQRWSLKPDSSKTMSKLQQQLEFIRSGAKQKTEAKKTEDIKEKPKTLAEKTKDTISEQISKAKTIEKENIAKLDKVTDEIILTKKDLVAVKNANESFMKDSPFVDKNGLPIVIYRGAPSKAAYSDTAGGFNFYSSSPSVAGDYAGTDITNRGIKDKTELVFRGNIMNFKSNEYTTIDADGGRWFDIGNNKYTDELTDTIENIIHNNDTYIAKYIAYLWNSNINLDTNKNKRVNNVINSLKTNLEAKTEVDKLLTSLGLDISDMSYRFLVNVLMSKNYFASSANSMALYIFAKYKDVKMLAIKNVKESGSARETATDYIVRNDIDTSSNIKTVTTANAEFDTNFLGGVWADTVEKGKDLSDYEMLESASKYSTLQTIAKTIDKYPPTDAGLQAFIKNTPELDLREYKSIMTFWDYITSGEKIDAKYLFNEFKHILKPTKVYAQTPTTDSNIQTIETINKIVNADDALSTQAIIADAIGSTLVYNDKTKKAVNTIINMSNRGELFTDKNGDFNVNQYATINEFINAAVNEFQLNQLVGSFDLTKSKIYNIRNAYIPYQHNNKNVDDKLGKLYDTIVAHSKANNLSLKTDTPLFTKFDKYYKEAIDIAADIYTDKYKQDYAWKSLDQFSKKALSAAKQTQEKGVRYLTNKEAKDSNLKYFIKKGVPIQLDKGVQNFVKYTTDGFDQLPKVLKDKIKSGTLTKFDIIHIVATAKTLNDYTFRAIAKYVYNNEYLANSSLKELQSFANNIEDMAAMAYVINKLDKTTQEKEYILSDNDLKDLPSLFNKLMEKVSKDEKAAKTYNKAKTLAETVKGPETNFKSEEYHADPTQLQPVIFNHYDGSLESIIDINNIGKWLSLKQKDAEYVDDANTAIEGGSDRWQQSMKQANVDYTMNDDVKSALIMLDRIDKINVIESYLFAKTTKEIQALPEDVRVNEGQRRLDHLNNKLANIDKASDNDIDQMYMMVLSKAGKDLDTKEDIVTEYKDQPKTDKNRKDEIRILAARVIERIGNLKSLYKELPASIQNMLIPRSVYKTMDQYKNAKGHYVLSDKYQSYSSKQLDILLNNFRDASKSIRQYIKTAKTAATRLHAVETKLTKTKTELEKAQKEIVRLKTTDTKQRKNVKDLVDKQYTTKIQTQEFNITSREEPTKAVVDMLNTSWSKKRMSTVQGLSNNMEQDVANGKLFFEQNADTLMSMSTSQAEQTANWFMDSVMNNVTNEEYRKYKAIELYFLKFVYENIGPGKQFEGFNANIKTKLANFINAEVSVGARAMSIHNSMMSKIDPYDSMKNADMELAGVELTADEKDLMMTAAKEGNMAELEKIQNTIIDRVSKTTTMKSTVLKRINGLRTMSMLSSPLTWLRNVVSNMMLKRLNKISSSIGNKVWKGEYQKGQLTMKGQITPDIQNYIIKNFIDNGLFSTVVDNISKYNPSDISKGGSITGPNKDAIFANMVIKSMYGKYYNEGMFKNSIVNSVHKKLMKVMSDNKYVREAAVRYLGKIIAEKGYDLTKGMTDQIMNDFANAVGLAMSDYMHTDNIFNTIERAILDKGEGWWFIYKQLLPFAASGWNWFKAGLRFSPIGLAMSIAKMARLEKTLIKAESDWATGKSQVTPELTEYLLRRNLGAGVIGTMTWMLGMALAAFGLIRLEDDDYGVPKLYIGDLKIDISAIFGSTSLLAGAAMVTEMAKNGLSLDTVLAGLNNQLDVLMDGLFLVDIMNLDTYSRSGLFSTSVNWLEATLLSFIPNGISWLAGATYTGTIDKSSLLGRAVAKIPFLAGIVGTKKANIYTGKTNNFWDLFNRVVPYVDVNQKSSNEKLTTELGLNKQQLKGQYTINDTSFNLSVKETAELNKNYGEWNAIYLTKFYDNKASYRILVDGTYRTLSYNNMTDEQRKTIAQRIMTENATYAKIQAWLDAGHKYYASASEYAALKERGVTGSLYKGTNGFVE